MKEEPGKASSVALSLATAGSGVVDALLLESVALSKESVRLDTSSERSWAGLGAAHLMLHVHVSSEAEDLHLAHRAFKQASKAAEAAHAQDASHIVNHATVLAMLDCPEEALRLFPFPLKLSTKEARLGLLCGLLRSKVCLRLASLARAHALKLVLDLKSLLAERCERLHALRAVRM